MGQNEKKNPAHSDGITNTEDGSSDLEGGIADGLVACKCVIKAMQLCSAKRADVSWQWPPQNILLGNLARLWNPLDDGNCLFWCFLQFLNKECTMENCFKLRYQISRYILKLPRDKNVYTSGDQDIEHWAIDNLKRMHIDVNEKSPVEQYAEVMTATLPNAQWGTDLEIAAFGSMQQINIAVYKKQANTACYELSFRVGAGEDRCPSMYLLFETVGHYQLMDPSTMVKRRAKMPEEKKYNEVVLADNMASPARRMVAAQLCHLQSLISIFASKSMEINDEDFRRDEGGTPEWKFTEMLKAGQSYLDLPVPRKLKPSIHDIRALESPLPDAKTREIIRKRSEACKLLRYISPQYISVMANTEIGVGTDPERLEQHLLTKKRQVLDRKIFATCQFYPGLSETVQTVHTITEESQLSNGKKIDFGIVGGFEGVQLGFEVANETSDWSRNHRIIAIADLRYQWAKTASRIHRNKLYKFLTKDCKEALDKINGDVVNSAELSRELSSFIGKYGTHVVLECTHGYRMEKVERMTVTSDKKLQEFKADIMASVLGYAGIHTGYQKLHLEAGERTANYLGIKSIGSKEHMKEAVEGGKDINFEEKMISNSSEGGDAGVISHDWNMMIAEMLLADKSPYKTAAKRLQFWTNVMINDLKAGWNEGLFATSYELKFVPEDQTMNDMSICVTIGERTVVHQHPGSGKESYCYITNVHTNEAKSVQISVLDDTLAIQEVLAKITVFRRVLRNYCVGEGVEGLVFATVIDTSGIDKTETQWELFDLSTDYDWEPEILDTHWKTAGKKQRREWVKLQEQMSDEHQAKSHVVTLGKARARVCRGGLQEEEPTTTTAQKEEEQELIEQIKSIARRDASFLLIAATAAIIFSWMELNAGNIEYRGINSDTRLLSSPNNKYQIIDAGYIATTPLYNFLKENRDWNDFFALINTVVGVFAPFLYIAWQTFWVGDYVPAFKYLFISAMRSMCGWCTFLPPDPSYLMSFKDFPDIIQCLQKDCGDVETAQVNPFLSFFSGHVATLVMCANHMYVRKNKKMCYFFHVFNVLQIIRLLATRGHYSIDIVIGWFMATRVSNPAGRLGRYFSRGDSSSFESALPSSASEVFEKLVGVDVVKEQARMSVLMKTNEVQNLLSQMKDPSEVFAEPTARMLAEDMLDELRDMISSSSKKGEKKNS